MKGMVLRQCRGARSHDREIKESTGITSTFHLAVEEQAWFQSYFVSPPSLLLVTMRSQPFHHRVELEPVGGSHSLEFGSLGSKPKQC